MMIRNILLVVLLTIVPMLPLCAQTKWVNPLTQGEAIVHGRWWHNELQDNYHRLPTRAENVVRKAVWNLSR